MSMHSRSDTGGEPGPPDDRVLVERATAGDERAIRSLIARHNQRLFRTARSVVRNDGEAEDIVQASYVKAFTQLKTFRGDSLFSTWLTRITINEALGRLRQRRSAVDHGHVEITAASEPGNVTPFPDVMDPANPETELSRQQVRLLLEHMVDKLPSAFRIVFVLREVEAMSVEEIAVHLSIQPATVRTRLHRARHLLRAALEARIRGTFSALFPFDGARCVSMADRVIATLRGE